MTAVCILESAGGDPAKQLCAVNKRFLGLCDNNDFWKALCKVRDWDRKDRLAWSREILDIPEENEIPYKRHYIHWRGLVHDNESLVRAVNCTVNWHSKYGPIAIWDTSRVTDMAFTFRDEDTFNADISKWDTSKVEDMRCMFEGAKKFNADISKWDTSKVTNMSEMFHGAKKFNADISKWKTSLVADMFWMFHGAKKFNQDISGWNVGNVTDRQYMFEGAEAFKYRNEVNAKWGSGTV